MNERVRIGLWGLCAIAVVSSMGCSSRVARRYAGPALGNNSSNWTVALNGPQIAQLAQQSPELTMSPELWRRDDALSLKSRSALTALDRWPADPRPSLDRQRWLTLPTQSDRFLYFSNRSTSHRGLHRRY